MQRRPRYVVPVQNAQVFGHDADSLALPPDAAIFLPCLRSVDKRVKLRKTCEGGWDPPVSEAGWRKNRSAQTLSFEAAGNAGLCHSDFGPGDFGPAGPKSPENTAGISVRGTIITRDIGPGPDILVRVADLLGELRFCNGSILSLWPSTAL